MSRQQGIVLYTDGACRGNPGPGGWGVLMQTSKDQSPLCESTLCGGEINTTNNRMELMAAIKGLEALPEHSQLKLYTDSKYVQQGITQWIHGWKQKGWMTAAKKPVKNQELWQQLDALVQRHQVEWCWVKGHAGDPGNERADQLANQGLDKVLRAG